MKLTVIIPVYNERKTIKTIINAVSKVKLAIDKEIVIIDDHSTDGTDKVLAKIKQKNVRIFRHAKNQGKGMAIRTGLSKAKGDLIIIQDADLEYDPKSYPALIKPILDGETRVVYGSRFMGNTLKMVGKHKTILPHHLIGNKLLTWATNLLYGRWISDMETCYKVFRRDCIDNIKLKSKKFDFEPEVTAKLLKSGEKIIEIPITYSPRGFEEGKKINWRDGLMALWTLIKYRLVD